MAASQHWLTLLVLVVAGACAKLTGEDQAILDNWVAKTDAVVPETADKARIVQILKNEEKPDKDTKDLSPEEIADEDFLEFFLPREDESAVEIDDETDLSDVQFFGKNRMREEFNNSMKAGYIIPEAWDSYAKGWVTSGKKQKTGICYAFAATALLETCYLKATLDPDATPPPTFPSDTNNALRSEFQKGLDMAETFPIRCKNMNNSWLDPKLGFPYKSLGFIKRLAGVSPSESDWQSETKYNRDCAKAMAKMHEWPTADAHVVKYGAGLCGGHESIRYFVSKYGAVAISSIRSGGPHYEVIYGYGKDEDGEYYLLKNSYGWGWRNENEDGKILGSSAFPKIYLGSEKAHKMKKGVLGGGICTYAQCAKGDMAENKNDICVMGDIRGLKKGFQELQGRKTVKLDCETFHVEEKEMNKKNARKECEMLENEASKENPDPIKVAEWEQFQQGGKEVEKTQPVKIWCEGKTCSRTTCRKYLCRCMDKFNSPGSCCSYFQEWGIATKS